MEQTSAQMLGSQIVSLAWIRCLIEEGVNFFNKATAEVEKSELVIYDSFERGTGLFDMPSAKASRWGLEKNILEVYGSYCLNHDDPYMISLLFSPELKDILKEKIAKVKEQT